MISRRVVCWFLPGLLAGVGSVMASSPVVLPGHPVARNAATFSAIDVDKDGKVTEAEYVKYELHRRFEAADVNKDGKLSKKEYLASFKNEPGAHVTKDDWKVLNGSKEFITMDEFMHSAGAAKEISAQFKKLDPAGRGYVTMTEWTKGKKSGKQAGAGQ